MQKSKQLSMNLTRSDALEPITTETDGDDDQCLRDALFKYSSQITMSLPVDLLTGQMTATTHKEAAANSIRCFAVPFHPCVVWLGSLFLAFFCKPFKSISIGGTTQ